MRSKRNNQIRRTQRKRKYKKRTQRKNSQRQNTQRQRDKRRKTQRIKRMIGGMDGDGRSGGEENPLSVDATTHDLFDDTPPEQAKGDSLSMKHENFKRRYEELSNYYETIKSVFELTDEENMNIESLSALFPNQLKKIKFLYCATLIFLIKLLRDIQSYSVIAYIPKIKDLYNDLVEKIKTKIDLLKKYNYGLQKENIKELKFYSNNEYCKNLFNNDYRTLRQIIMYTLQSLSKTKTPPIELEVYKQHVDALIE